MIRTSQVFVFVICMFLFGVFFFETEDNIYEAVTQDLEKL